MIIPRIMRGFVLKFLFCMYIALVVPHYFDSAYVSWCEQPWVIENMIFLRDIDFLN